MILIDGPNGKREVEEGKPYRLEPGERIVGSYRENKQSDKLDYIAKDNEIGVGSLMAAVTESTGFKKWWDEKHGGECIPCKKRQATLDYIKFQGPIWLVSWVKKWVKNSDS